MNWHMDSSHQIYWRVAAADKLFGSIAVLPRRRALRRTGDERII